MLREDNSGFVHFPIPGKVFNRLETGKTFVYLVAFDSEDVSNKAYELSNKGVAFNFLTEEFMGSEDHNFNCFNPEEFIGMINKIYPKTRLITDYLGNEDFTIYIYK